MRWDLPESWEWAQTSDVATIVAGGTPAAGDPTNFAEPGIPWLTPADLSKFGGTYSERGARSLSPKGLAESSARRLPKGTVLFTSRAPIGYCTIAANEITTNQGFKNLILKPGLVPEFIRHYLLASKDYAESLASGTTFLELSGSRMAEVELPVAPTNEQKRIVARLDALQSRSRAAREALAEVPALLDTFRQSVLAAAFRGDLTAEWRAENPGAEPASKLLERIRAERKKRWELVNPKKKYAEPERVDDSELPELPDGWNWVSIDEITVDSLYGPRFASDAYCKDGVPTIRTTDLDAHGRVCPKDPPRVRVDAERMNDWGLQQDDLVVTRTGATIGKCALYDASIGPAVPSAYLIRFRLTRDNCHARFVFWFLQSPFGQVLLGSGSRAVAQPNVNATAIRGFPMPLPPYEEQRRITALLDTAEAAFAASRDTASEFRDDLDALDQSILARAFRGELVDQDPNDEPAEALLARIRSGGDDGAPRRGRRGPAKHGPGGTR